MKKQIIIALALSLSAFSFGQKKELKAVEKALQNGNFSDAKESIKKAEGLMDVMDEKTKAKYYFLNGKILYANGVASTEDIKSAVESLDKVETGYDKEVKELKRAMLSSLLNKGNDAYEKGSYSKASVYFENAYRISPKDTTYLYYAASASVNSKEKEYERALSLYEELKTLKFTGIGKQYFATNKSTGKEELYDKTSRDVLVKSGSHIKPGERTTKSKKAEIVKNVALIYLSLNDNDKALAALKEARSENPDDIDIILSEANINHKMGNTEAFKELLILATEKDPNNAELQYNLGVISSDSGDVESAKKYYTKAIELDANYINAYINMSALVLEKEQPIIKEMNGLGNSSADNKRYDKLRAERQNIYKEAVPYLTKALEIDAESISAAKTLMNIYSILGETDKYKSLKSKVAALEGGN